METNRVLYCKFSNLTYALSVSLNMKYVDLVEMVCGRWHNLNNSLVVIFYSLPDCPRCLVGNDMDIQLMFSLSSEYGINRIHLYIEDGSKDNEDLRLDECGDNEVVGDVSVERFEEKAINRNTISQCIEQCLLSDAWAVLLNEVGQKFEGGADHFRDSLCKYAIQCGFKFKYVKNESNRVTAECLLRFERDCKWRVHASLCAYNGCFYIKSFNRNHTCGASVRSSKHPRMSSEIVSKEILGMIRDKPMTTPTDIVRDFKMNYGFDISYHHAWLGVEKARGHLYGDQQMSYDQLRWYMDAAISTNAGSVFDLDYDRNSKHFKRFFVSFGASINGFNTCRPMIFLDGTFLKSRYKGNLLAATTKDGNQGIFPIAFAIVLAENEENWRWFLERLKMSLPGGRVFTFISDRNAGLIESVARIYPDAFHAFCYQHLKFNFKDKIKYVQRGTRERLLELFRKCAYATSEVDYNVYMNELLNEGGQRVSNFFEYLPKEQWSNAFFKGKRYGEMCSNVAESFNSWIRDARSLPILELVDRIRLKMMTLLSKRREHARKWNSVLCPAIDSILKEHYIRGRTWVVSVSSDDVFEVHSVPSHSVDLGSMFCTCKYWQIYGIPCAHAVVAIQRSGRDLNMFVEQYFHTKLFESTYSHSIFPIPSFDKPVVKPTEVVVLPPHTRRQPGRPKNKRIPSKGEVIRQMRCGRCGRLGHHNRKSCRDPI